MAKTKETRIGYSIFCPACQREHFLNTGQRTDTKVAWGFNGDVDKPTFTPSLRVRFHLGRPEALVMCHSYITDGHIKYLSDCTHGMAGQTVEIPDII